MVEGVAMMGIEPLWGTGPGRYYTPAPGDETTYGPGNAISRE